MKKSYYILVLLTTIFFVNNGNSQESAGGVPISFSAVGLSDNIEVINLSAPNLAEFIPEDIENDENNFPQRIAANVPANINIYSSGSWEKIEPGGKVWRIKLVCDGALALKVQFDKFYLPEGSELYLYNEEKTHVLGAYTSINNYEAGVFSTELVKGDAVIVEYYEPLQITTTPILHIADVAYAYRNVSFLFDNTDDFGDSDYCQVNVNCSPEGDNWQDEKRGVARILYKEGSYWYWCTGSLVNNTLENGTPYFLTADHCGGSASTYDRNQWIFYFNYESSGCSNPGSSPSYNSLTGASLKARGEIDGGSDFQLVQLNSTPPSYYNIYYNGWDKSGSSSSSGVGIHHPSGDIKKISTYTSTLSSATWNGSGSIGATNAHWRTSWSSTSNGHGVSEGGSSGSPIFNSSGRVLGTLTGGSSNCSTPYWDLYGKFSYHWQSNGSSSSDRLRPWLDPNSSGVTYLDGYDPNAANPPVTDFEADITTPSIGQTVNFTDLSSDNPTSWSWTFTPSTITYVGGTNSSSQNPQVQFNSEGNYNVSLTASNPYGSDAESKSNYINASYYCGASGASSYLEIIRVELGDIDNSSGQDNYADYTYLSTDIAKDQLYNITITNGDPSYTDADLGIWIDWNQNGIFNNTDERIVCEVSNSGQGTYSFTVPTSATTGSTRMRIRTKFNGDDCGDPCGTATYGEVEDYTVNVIGGNIVLDLTAMLEGPFDASSMNTILNGQIPLNQPYNVSPWFYAGTENVSSIPINVVDWVLIDLRDAASASNATGATSVAMQAAFILNDGSIVELDGSSNLQFPVSISHGLYVVVWQRNHIGIISNYALTPSGGVYTYNFTSGVNQVYGGIDGHKQLASGIWGMFSGDGDRNGLIDDGDKSSLWDIEAGTKGYIPSDYNLDSESNNIDKDEYWLPNIDEGSQVPQ